MKPFILAGAMMLAVSTAAAQANNQRDDQPPPTPPCQAEPDQSGNTGNGSDEKAPPPGDLTRKLGSCDGVLKPPPTGDADLTTPAPNQGNTPVIKPGQLPQQQPKK